MPSTAMRILAIGELLPSTRDILRRLAERGWGARNVSSLSDARDLLHTFDFDVTLAAEALRDGRGYDLGELIAEHLRSLFVGVALSESCLWLPVVFRGANVLGERALNPKMLEAELDSLLGSHARESTRNSVSVISRKSAFPAAHPGPEGSALFRRKYRDRDHLPM
jgi:hypothetical protein